MKIYIKYLISFFAVCALTAAINNGNLASGICAAGAFIAYAMIEIQDLKIMNQEDS